MTDQELLTLAAKAVNGGGWHPLTHEKPWNPLVNDGDALRLAVKLGAAIYPPEADGDDATVNVRGEDSPWISEPVVNGDPFAATRRAIVRAAAEIGRSKT